MLSLLVISLIACVQTNLVFQMRKRFRKDSADIGVLDQTTGSKINIFLNKKKFPERTHIPFKSNSSEMIAHIFSNILTIQSNLCTTNTLVWLLYIGGCYLEVDYQN